MAKYYIPLTERLPEINKFVWLKQQDFTERAFHLGNGNFELILPRHKCLSMVTKPTHWKDDTH